MVKTKFWSIHDDNINYESVYDFLENKKWKWHRERIHNYNKDRKIKNHLRITKQTLKLQNRIEKELNINIFPVIFKLKNTDISTGGWKWLVYDEYQNDLGSSETVTQILKGDKLELIISYSNREIITINKN
jgi:hypothetical protein